MTVWAYLIQQWPVIYRTFLYGGAAFLTSLSDKLIPVLSHDQWPTPQRWLLALLVAAGATFITLRAYSDGSAQRHQDMLASKLANRGHDTDFLVNPNAPKPAAG